MIFRRTDKYGYSRYYGGGGPAFVIKVVVTILVIAALVLGGITLALQRYMVYTANGGHLELPWASSADASDSTGGDGSGGTDGILITDEEGDQSADAAEISADASGSQSDGDASASAQPEEEEPADESAQAEASTGETSGEDASETSSEESDADASSNADTSAEGDEGEEKMGFFQRILAFFANLFSTRSEGGDASLIPDESSSVAEGSASAGADSSQQAEANASGDESAQAEPAEETTRPEALTGGLLLQHVSIGDVTTGYAEGDLSNVGANGIMLYLKESSGALNYASSLDLSAVLNVSCSESKSASIADTIAELNEDDYYTLAYIDCFQDGSAGALSDYQLYDESGDAWSDGEDCAWADPANEDFQDYIIGMVQELAAMGYDEIVLNNAAYPTTGDTDELSGDCYDPDTFEATVSSFYARLAEAVEGTDTILSVITTADAITDGADAVTGQSLENMLQLGGRLWVEADTDDAEALNEALVAAGYPDNALGLLVGSLDDDSDWCQMNLD